MAWTIVVGTDKVRERMSLPDLPDVNSAIESALNAVHPFVQSPLDTLFDEATGLVDYFFADDDKFPINPEGAYTLRLRRGFVTSIAAVRTSTLKLDFEGAVDLVYGTDYTYDADKGLVFVEELVGKDQYISVEYAAGVTEQTAPFWLQETVLAIVPLVLAANNKEEGKPVNVQKQMADLASSMLEPHLRGRSFQFRPYYTVG